MTAEHKKLRSSMEQRVVVSNNELACLDVKVVKMSQAWDASVANPGQMSLEVKCASGLAVKSKKLCECVSSIVTAGRANVSKGGKLPGPKSKRKNADVEASV